MKLTIIVEGKTEIAFKSFLRGFLEPRLEGRMPVLDFFPYNGPIPQGEKLRRVVTRLLHSDNSDAVIALTDVYTGSEPPVFSDAAEAKEKMQKWVGEESNFFPHAAQHDFEAWLLPYWDRIKQLAASNRNAPSGAPESVNHMKPPSRRLQEVFRTGERGQRYIKARDVARILGKQDLLVSAQRCPELKSFLNTILSLCGGTEIP